MKKRIIALQIVLILLLNMVLPSVNLAVDEQTDADYLISSKEELIAFANEVNGGNDYSGKIIKLTADIFLEGSESSQWTPIGTKEHKFNGTFDGNGFKVDGMYMNNSEITYQGLFGYNAGTIQNLVVSNAVIVDGNGYTGVIAGYNYGKIYNCSNENSKATVTTGRAYQDEYNGVVNTRYDIKLGGIVGSNFGIIQKCNNLGEIKTDKVINSLAPNTDATFTVGGVTGHNSGEILGCANLGTVKSREDLGSDVVTYSYLGGIAGSSLGNICNSNNNGTIIGRAGAIGGIAGYVTSGKIQDCFNIKDINLNVTLLGGIVGYAYGGSSTSKIEIINCYNTGNISGAMYAAGIGGQVASTSSNTSSNIQVLLCDNEGEINGTSWSAGIVAMLGNATVEQCYNKGLIKGNTYLVGGIVAETSNLSVIRYCYNTGTVEGDDINTVSYGGIVGRSYTQVLNCYNVGNVKYAIVGSTNANIQNCYYLDSNSTAGYKTIDSQGISVGIEVKTQTQMKQSDFVELLNNGMDIFKIDSKNINDGYPIFASSNISISFQDEKLYQAIIEILEDKVESNDDDTKTIEITEDNINQITKLELAEKQITDISGIEKFTNLQELQIYSNSIEDISVLQNNETLRIINLNNNQLSDDDMQIFSTMPNLEILGIAHNKSITKIGELSKATNLLELNAINNEISDLVGIERLTNLQELYLSGNKIEDISLIPEIATVELKNQNVDKLIKGDKRDELLITLPEILEQALNVDSPYYSDEGLELVNVTIENEKIKLKPYTVAKNGGSIKIKSGILQDSYINFISLCTEYQTDLTSEENFEIYGIDLDLDSNGEINEEDAELIKKWYENGELTEEQQQKVSKMDLNMDGKITGRDYRRFLNYINKSSNYLLTAPIEIGEKVNTNVIVGIITNRQFSSPGVESVLEGFNMVFEQNGEYEYFDEDPILAVVDFIDKDAPEYEIRYSTTEPTSGDVTVTITANEELMNIYQIEDIQPEEEAEETEEEEKYNPWILSENKKVLTKTYTENAEEELEIIDLANNRTTIQIKVENIMKGEPLPAELIFTYEDGEEYFQGEWTNQNVKVKIDEDSIYEGFTAKYSIDGQGEYTQEQIISQEGEHSVVLTTTDQAGNISNEEYIVSIDKTNPEVGNIIAKEESSSGQSVANNSTTAKNLYISVQDGNDTLSGHQKTVYTINDGEEQTESQILRNEGTYNIKVITYDEAGNYSENSYTYTIDKGAPKATVTYTQNANKTVTATITANKELQPVDGWTLSNDRLSMTKTYSINKQETVEISDLLGNTTTVIVNIQGIENTEFLVDVDYSTTKPTKDGVIVTITSNKQMKQLSGFTLSQDKMTQSKTYLNNVQEQIIVQDLNNNQVILNISISNIDRQAPSATITYSTKQITNQDVTVTIQADEKVQNISGWNQTSDLKKLVKIYSQNTNETINLTDLAGNVTQIPIVISNINKENLQIQTSYSTKNVTNQNVTVTLSSNIPLKVLSGWTLSEDNMKLTKEYTKNTTENIEVQSQLGQKQNVTVDIKNIDKIAPNATVTYSTTDKTTKPVTVTITANEKIQEVTGWERNTEQNTLTKTYTENTKENIVISDLAGNQTSVTIDVNQIEKEIQSPYYDITEDGYILGITPDTTKEEFISKLGYEAEMENTQIVKTGMNVKIEGRTYTLVVTGDINQDGCMDIQDLSKLLLHLGEYEDTILTGVQLMAADVNCDGKNDLMDLSKMCMVIAGDMEI